MFFIFQFYLQPIILKQVIFIPPAKEQKNDFIKLANSNFASRQGL